MLPETPIEQYSDVLDETVAEVLAAARVVAPPVDVLRVADALGIIVARDDHQPGRARYVRLRAMADGVGSADDGDRLTDDRLVIEPPEQASILLRSDPRHERRQWAVAHELGEHAAVRVFHRLGVDPHEAPPATRENVANSLANRLLLPTAWFHRLAVETDWDLIALKARFVTASHELIAKRTLDFDTPAIVTICDHRRVSFRRATLGRRVARMCEIERECWQRANRTARFAAAEAGEVRVRCWPIHEPGWQREIMRSEWSGDDVTA